MESSHRESAIEAYDDFTCQQVIALLVDYVDGTLQGQTARMLQEHLQDCPECVAFLRTYTATLRTTRTLRDVEMPPALQDRVLRFLRERRPELAPSCCQSHTG